MSEVQTVSDTVNLHSISANSLPRVLMPGEAKELASCEQIIERGLETFIEVGTALANIREKRLYRVSFETFDDYCQSRWKIHARRARYLCAAAETVRNLGLPDGKRHHGAAFALPASERQARPLACLPPEEQRSAWAEAVATAPGGRVTARHVEQVVQSRLGKMSPPPGPAPPIKNPLGPSPGSARSADTTPSRQARQLAVVDEAIAKVRECVSLGGTADSEAAADLTVALQKLEVFKEHLGHVAKLQENRP